MSEAHGHVHLPVVQCNKTLAANMLYSNTLAMLDHLMCNYLKGKITYEKKKNKEWMPSCTLVPFLFVTFCHVFQAACEAPAGWLVAYDLLDSSSNLRDRCK